jgi:hypothetical protein
MHFEPRNKKPPAARKLTYARAIRARTLRLARQSIPAANGQYPS